MDLSRHRTAWLIAAVVDLQPSWNPSFDFQDAVLVAERRVNQRWDGHDWLARAPEKQAGRSPQRLLTVVFTVDNVESLDFVYKARGDLMFDIKTPADLVRTKLEQRQAAEFAEGCLIECCQQAAKRWKTPIEQSADSMNSPQAGEPDDALPTDLLQDDALPTDLLQDDALPMELIEAVRLAASKTVAGRPRRMMAEKDFWSLIGVMHGGVDRDAVRRLRDALTELSRAKVEAFHRRLVNQLHELDRQIIADQPVRWVDDPSDEEPVIPLSDDAFLYLRAAIVAMGPTTYEAVLADPSLLSQGRWDGCEDLLHVAEEVTGAPIDTTVSYETGSNTNHWPPPPQPQREPWDQGPRPVVVLLRDLTQPIHAIPGAGGIAPPVIYPPPRWLSTDLASELTVTFARLVTLHGGLPAQLGSRHLRVHIDLGESWHLQPEVTGPVPDELGHPGELIVQTNVGVPTDTAKAWTQAVRAEALTAVTALALLTALPADHAARPHIQSLYDLGAHHLPT